MRYRVVNSLLLEMCVTIIQIGANQGSDFAENGVENVPPQGRQGAHSENECHFLSSPPHGPHPLACKRMNGVMLTMHPSCSKS